MGDIKITVERGKEKEANHNKKNVEKFENLVDKYYQRKR